MRRIFARVLGSHGLAWVSRSRPAQAWRRATGRQRAFAVVGLVGLAALLLAPVALQVHASQSSQVGRGNQSPVQVDPRAAAKRFQQLHFGKSKPAAAAYQHALQQAAKLPRSALGAAPRVSTVKGATTPATVPGT